MVVLGLGPLACVPEAGDESGDEAAGDTGQGSEEETTGETGEETSGEETSEEGATEDTAATEDEGETGEDACELPENEGGSGEQATITVTNDSDGLRYLFGFESQCSNDQFSIRVDGQPLIIANPFAPCSNFPCGQSCLEEMGTMFILEPGHAVEFTWNGMGWTNNQLGQACQGMVCESGPNAGSSCQTLQDYSGLEFTAGIRYLDTCPPNRLPEDCGCDEGVCAGPYSDTPPGTEVLEATAVFPSDVVFSLD